MGQLVAGPVACVFVSVAILAQDLHAGAQPCESCSKKNFLIVDSKTHQFDIEELLQELTNRKDISIIFIIQGCAEIIGVAVDAYSHSGQLGPTILEIPSKEQPYDPHKDAIMQRAAFFMPTAMASLGIEVGPSHFALGAKQGG